MTPTGAVREPEGGADPVQDQYRAIIDSAPLLISVLQDGKTVFTNARAVAAIDQLGIRDGGQVFFERVHPEDRARLLERQAAVLAGTASTAPQEYRVVRPHGRTAWYRIQSSRIEWQGRPAILSFLHDITVAKETEKALKVSEGRYDRLVQNLSAAVIEYDVATDRILAVNPCACQTLGYTQEEMLAMRPDDLLGVDTRQLRAARVEKIGRGEPVPPTVEYQVKTKAGRELSVLLNITIYRTDEGALRTAIVANDITEKKKLEAEMQRIEKVESLGVLAGGIAHDFNNILTAILGSVSLARLSVPGQDSTLLLAETEQACLRARDLTQQLLTFARGGAPVKKTTVIGPALALWTSFALRGSAVQSRCEIAPELWPTDVDESQLSQVVHNLVLNAAQSMPNGGVVELVARNRELSARDPVPLAPGRYVEVAVTDHGSGIAAQDLSRVFDPFFTTKPTGSGLGLTTAHSIVKRHGGHIGVDSRPAVGTTFTFYLPAAAVRSASDAKLPRAAPRGGTGTLLLMDDDAAVRRVGEQMLVQLGYQVVAVPDGAAAVREFLARKAADRPFTAVILDLTVPGGMGGLEALRALLAIDPQVRAIVSSGYSTAPVMANARAHGFAGMVAKPFTIDDLDRALGAAGLNLKSLEPARG